MGRRKVDWYGGEAPAKPLGALTVDYLNRTMKELYESAGATEERKVDMRPTFTEFVTRATAAVKHLGLSKSNRRIDYMTALIQQTWCAGHAAGFSDGAQDAKAQFEKDHPAAERQRALLDASRVIGTALDAMGHATMYLRDVVKDIR